VHSDGPEAAHSPMGIVLNARIVRTPYLLFALCLCGLAANVSGRTIEPLVIILSAEFAVGVATAALLVSAYALPFALGQPVLGPMGDIFGKAIMLRVSLWILTICLILSVLAPTYEALFLLRFCAGLAAGGTVPACMATIGDAWPPEQRQLTISRFVTMGLLAQIFAASAAGALAEYASWRLVLAASALFALAGALAATFLIRTEPMPQKQSYSIGLAAAGYRSVFRNPRAPVCYGTVFLEGVFFYGILPYIGAILVTQGSGSATQAGIIIGAVGIGGLFYIFQVSALLRRFGRPQMMAAGGLIMTLGPLTLAMAPPWEVVAAAFAMTGFGFMLLHNSIQTEVVDIAPNARQSAYSLHAFSFFTGQAVGPAAFGSALHLLGPTTGLILFAAVLAGTGLFAGFFFSRQAPQQE